jgi:hypothetical protein
MSTAIFFPEPDEEITYSGLENRRGCDGFEMA